MNDINIRVSGDKAAALLRIVDLTDWDLDEVVAYVLDEGIERGPWSTNELEDALPADSSGVKAREADDIRVNDLVVDFEDDLGAVAELFEKNGESYALVVFDFAVVDDEVKMAENPEGCEIPTSLLRLANLLP